MYSSRIKIEATRNIEKYTYKKNEMERMEKNFDKKLHSDIRIWKGKERSKGGEEAKTLK